MHPVAGGGPLPAYVRRPHDERLRVILAPPVASSRLVVVRGEPGTGTTRAAWEAVAELLAEWPLEYPRTAAALAARRPAAGSPVRASLWTPRHKGKLPARKTTHCDWHQACCADEASACGALARPRWRSPAPHGDSPARSPMILTHLMHVSALPRKRSVKYGGSAARPDPCDTFLHGFRNWRQPPGRVVWPTSIRCPSGSRR